MAIVFARVLILYVAVLVSLRLMGKKQVGTLQPYELVTIILMADIAAIPMASTGTPLINGLVGIFALLLAQVSVSFLTLKSVRARSWISGRPTIVIANGKIVEPALEELRYNLHDLIEQLRFGGYPDIHDVEFAVLETNGQLSIIPKSQKRPVRPGDLQVPTDYEGLPTPLIVDGQLDERNLAKVGLDRRWLHDRLREHGVRGPEDVLFASLDTRGNFYCQPRLARTGVGAGARAGTPS